MTFLFPYHICFWALEGKRERGRPNEEKTAHYPQGVMAKSEVPHLPDNALMLLGQKTIFITTQHTQYEVL